MTTRAALALLRDVARDHSTWTTRNVVPSPTSLRVSSVWNCQCGALLTDSWQGLETVQALLENHQLEMMEAALHYRFVNGPATLLTQEGRAVATAEAVDGGATFAVPESEQVIEVIAVKVAR